MDSTIPGWELSPGDLFRNHITRIPRSAFRQYSLNEQISDSLYHTDEILFLDN